MTGLFFGSFNPIHSAHLQIAEYFIANSVIKDVCFVVSPQNPFKTENGLLDTALRLELVALAIEDNPQLTCSDVELSLPSPSYTAHTLEHLKSLYPDQEYCIIMGTDNLQNFEGWKNYQHILDNYQLYVYPRKGSDGGSLKDHTNVHLIDSMLLEASASEIREQLNSAEAKKWLPKKVHEKILKEGYY
ncbi:MAG: nicotinic acid mononucleotide adenylyltransferase, partial [Bacteroidetes bacterium]